MEINDPKQGVLYDYIQDDDGKEFKVDIEFTYLLDSYYRERIIYCEVTPRETYHATEQSVQQSVIALVELVNKMAYFDCEVKVLEYKPVITLVPSEQWASKTAKEIIETVK